MSFNDFGNAQVAKLPKHLRQYMVEQHYEKYTPIDQAVWRYVMRQNYNYLKHVAYYPYIKGLERTGLSIERIPDLQTMNDSLGKIGWGAVCVDGFIPPTAFMEYQACQVLVIAADIRRINHIEYTPAPDIIHESAGHAPIIADADYNAYLSYFGSIGAKGMFSRKDFELYEAIRKLSILKEAVGTTEEEVAEAEQKLKYISENMGEPSEMALLTRLHWWTVEYGLIGTLENPKIYGAGLLSSIGESVTCMNPKVKKLWYNIDAINYPFDITKAQPQLFVTPTFQNLIDVLESYANTMSFRVGGAKNIRKAIECKNPATAVYSSGLQVTGIFSDLGLDADNELTFIKTQGSSALAFAGKQLTGHGKDYHCDGFSSPVGKLKDAQKPLENYTDDELAAIGVAVGQAINLTFESGINVKGLVTQILRQKKHLILITLHDCTVTEANGNKLFKPEWGAYDMAIGEKIVSVFNGAADKDAFEEITHVSVQKTCQAEYDQATVQLNKLYLRVSQIRINEKGFEDLKEIFDILKEKYCNDWLCALQILEILHHQKIDVVLEKEVRMYLEMMAVTKKEFAKLIGDGLHIIANPVTQPVAE